MTESYKKVKFKYPLKHSRIRWALFSIFDIPSQALPGFVYLRRLRIVQTPWFGNYLHWIFTPDLDQDPHDHPWPFWTIVLRGGYDECRWKIRPCCVQGSLEHAEFSIHRWKRFSIHKVDMDEAHQIFSIKPNTTTLVFVGRRRREWGFYTPDGFVDWRKYKNGAAL
jgi:hypothetical protein